MENHWLGKEVREISLLIIVVTLPVSRVIVFFFLCFEPMLEDVSSQVKSSVFYYCDSV